MEISVRYIAAYVIIVIFSGILIFLNLFDIITIFQTRDIQVEVKLERNGGVHVPIIFVAIPFKVVMGTSSFNNRDFCC